MASHGSACVREETPHENETTITISDAVRRRAQSLIDDTSIDSQWRAVIRYCLETNDRSLADLVRGVEAGEKIIDTIEAEETRGSDDNKDREKVETMVEIICRQGGEAAAALFVLMGTLQNSSEPEALANTAKHYAFTRCGEFNIFGLVDAQITVIEGELLASSGFVS